MIYHRMGKSCATSRIDRMPSSIAVCCLLKILDLWFHLTQTRKAMDIFKLSAFDLMLARPNLINRFLSNPSCASTQLFLGRRRDKSQTQIN
jgi:hypothetical protein